MADIPAALTSAQARKLGQWAKKNHGQSLSWLRGYLFSLAALPVPLPAHIWLSQLKADEMGPLLEQQFALLAADVANGTPKLPSGCSLTPDCRDNFQQGLPLSDWSRGFDQAMSLIFALWEELLPQLEESVAEELDACWCMLSFFADLPEAVNLTENGPISLEQMCLATRGDLPTVLKRYAYISTQLRESLPTPAAGEEEALLDLLQSQPEMESEAYFDQLEQLWEQAMSSDDLDERARLLEAALDTTATALGEECFEHNAGAFWGLMETRPYMQTLALLIECYQMQGQLTQAISQSEWALQLCPSDNLGLRYPLIGMLLETRQYSRVHALMEQFDESSVFFHYTRALLGYIEQRGSLKATSARKKAVKANRHFPELLRNRTDIPEERVPHYSPGDKNEALMLLEFMGNAWYNTDDAVRWLCSKQK